MCEWDSRGDDSSSSHNFEKKTTTYKDFDINYLEFENNMEDQPKNVLKPNSIHRLGVGSQMVGTENSIQDGMSLSSHTLPPSLMVHGSEMDK